MNKQAVKSHSMLLIFLLHGRALWIMLCWFSQCLPAELLDRMRTEQSVNFAVVCSLFRCTRLSSRSFTLCIHICNYHCSSSYIKLSLNTKLWTCYKSLPHREFAHRLKYLCTQYLSDSFTSCFIFFVFFLILNILAVGFGLRLSWWSYCLWSECSFLL